MTKHGSSADFNHAQQAAVIGTRRSLTQKRRAEMFVEIAELLGCDADESVWSEVHRLKDARHAQLNAIYAASHPDLMAAATIGLHLSHEDGKMAIRALVDAALEGMKP